MIEINGFLVTADYLHVTDEKKIIVADDAIQNEIDI